MEGATARGVHGLPPVWGPTATNLLLDPKPQSCDLIARCKGRVPIWDTFVAGSQGQGSSSGTAGTVHHGGRTVPRGVRGTANTELWGQTKQRPLAAA